MSGHKGVALPLGRGGMLDGPTTERVQRFVQRVGVMKARERLQVGNATLDAARELGRITPAAARRLLAALEREEAALQVAS
ncbi:MAG: hypothetical protein QOG85_836 [Gaiellaceae bacterium]|nr:hypothetical protein [Gaiellaceae bacterium]